MTDRTYQFWPGWILCLLVNILIEIITTPKPGWVGLAGRVLRWAVVLFYFILAVRQQKQRG